MSKARQAVVRRTTTAGTTLLRAFLQSSAVATLSLKGGSISMQSSSFMVDSRLAISVSDPSLSSGSPIAFFFLGFGE